VAAYAFGTLTRVMNGLDNGSDNKVRRQKHVGCRRRSLPAALEICGTPLSENWLAVPADASGQCAGAGCLCLRLVPGLQEPLGVQPGGE
jgi:hypothetical protein